TCRTMPSLRSPKRTHCLHSQGPRRYATALPVETYAWPHRGCKGQSAVLQDASVTNPGTHAEMVALLRSRAVSRHSDNPTSCEGRRAAGTRGTLTRAVAKIVQLDHRSNKAQGKPRQPKTVRPSRSVAGVSRRRLVTTAYRSPDIAPRLSRNKSDADRHLR